MKPSIRTLSKAALVAAAGAVIATASIALADPPGGGGGGGCWRPITCLDVWDPVVCDNGVTYSNACYAYRACATGCVPTGGGGPVPLE